MTQARDGVFFFLSMVLLSLSLLGCSASSSLLGSSRALRCSLIPVVECLDVKLRVFDVKLRVWLLRSHLFVLLKLKRHLSIPFRGCWRRLGRGSCGNHGVK